MPGLVRLRDIVRLITFYYNTNYIPGVSMKLLAVISISSQHPRGRVCIINPHNEMCVYRISTVLILSAPFFASSLTTVRSADGFVHEQMSRRGGSRASALIYGA